MSKSIYDISVEYQTLLDIAESGFDAETGEVIDEEHLNAAFDVIQESVEKKVANTAQVVRKIETEAQSVLEEAKRLADKARALSKSSDFLKDLIRGLMVQTGTSKVKTPYVSVSVGKKSLSVEANPDVIPKEYQVVRISADKKAIKDAITNGVEVPGARLVEGKPRLTIR